MSVYLYIASYYNVSIAIFLDSVYNLCIITFPLHNDGRVGTIIHSHVRVGVCLDRSFDTVAALSLRLAVHLIVHRSLLSLILHPTFGKNHRNMTNGYVVAFERPKQPTKIVSILV